MLTVFYAVNFLYLCVSDPFAAVFGNESFGGGFADFSALAKVFKLLFMPHHALPSHIVWREAHSILISSQ